ncbi:MAG: hypothetical protein ACREOQ_14315 [Gemmatimonadales bacterium]
MSADSTPRPQPGPFWRAHQSRAVRALRELLTPAVVRDIIAGAPGEDVGHALGRLQRLQPGQTTRAIWCHRVLARAVREDLRSLGWVDPRYAEALRHLAVYLEHAGWEFAGGRWMVADPLPPLPACARLTPVRGPADTAAEPSVWDLGLSVEATARLRHSLARMRRFPPG